MRRPRPRPYACIRARPASLPRVAHRTPTTKAIMNRALRDVDLDPNALRTLRGFPGSDPQRELHLQRVVVVRAEQRGLDLTGSDQLDDGVRSRLEEVDQIVGRCRIGEADAHCYFG